MRKQWTYSEDGCWLWSGYVQKSGYASYTKMVDGKRPLAHRFTYEALVGPIPEGMVLDHLCRNRACVNPSHLEPVSMQENILRGEGFAATNAQKTHCKHGHPFDDENTWVYRGLRHCRTCRREADRKRVRVRV